jgi:hypothetical protein
MNTDLMKLFIYKLSHLDINKSSITNLLNIENGCICHQIISQILELDHKFSKKDVKEKENIIILISRIYDQCVLGTKIQYSAGFDFDLSILDAKSLENKNTKNLNDHLKKKLQLFIAGKSDSFVCSELYESAIPEVNSLLNDIKMTNTLTYTILSHIINDSHLDMSDFSSWIKYYMGTSQFCDTKLNSIIHELLNIQAKLHQQKMELIKNPTTESQQKSNLVSLPMRPRPSRGPSNKEPPIGPKI